jgi:hypothetical protein
MATEQPAPGHDEKLLDVSDHAKSHYGLSAATATATAMRDYGYALLTIAGADGKVSPKELNWHAKTLKVSGGTVHPRPGGHGDGHRQDAQGPVPHRRPLTPLTPLS